MKTFIFPIKNRDIKKKLGFQVKQSVYSLVQLDNVSRVEFISNSRNYMNMYIMDVHLLLFYFMTTGQVLLIRANDYVRVGEWSPIDNDNIVMEAKFEHLDAIFHMSVHKNIVTVRDFSSHSFYLMNKYHANQDHYRAVLMIPASPF